MSAPVQGGGGGQVWGSTAATTSHGRQRRPLLYFGPANFSKVIVTSAHGDNQRCADSKIAVSIFWGYLIAVGIICRTSSRKRL